MGIGPLSFTDRAAPSLPSGRLRLSLGSAIGPFVTDILPISSLSVPILEAVMYGSPVGHLHHHLEGDTLVTGLLAPKTGPTVAGLTQATAQLTFSGQPVDGDVILVGIGATPFSPNTNYGAIIYFRNALQGGGNHEVLIGANLQETIDNLQALVEGTNGHGTTYTNGWLQQGFTGQGQYAFDDRNDIEVSASTPSTITFRALTPGVIGNSYRSIVYVDSGGVMGGNFTGTNSYFTGGLGASGNYPLSGRYRYTYQTFRTKDGARSGIADLTEYRLDSPSNTTLSAFDTPPTRDEVDFYAWYRSTVGGGQGERYKGEDIATGSLPATDDQSDQELTGFFKQVYEPNDHRLYEDGYPVRHSSLVRFDAKVFAVGASRSAPYAGGQLSVTLNSYSFTLSSGGHWTEYAIGRNVYLDGGTDPYMVVEYDPSAHTGKFNRPCGLATASYDYELRDERDPFAVHWTASRKVNNWPTDNELVDVVSEDEAGIVGAVRSEKAIGLFTRTGKWRLESIGGNAYRAWPSAEGCGLYCHNAIVQANTDLYWLGPSGLFRGTVQGGYENLSHPPVDQEGARGIQRTWERINVDMANLIVGDYNSTTQTIRWILPLDGDEVCRHELVYDMRTGSLSLDFVGPRTFIRSVTGPDGKEHTLAGDPWGRVFEVDIGYADGGHGLSSTILTPTAWDDHNNRITFSGTPFADLDLEGTGLLIYTESDGDWEEAYAIASTDSTLTLDRPLSETPVGRKVMLGAIVLWMRTGLWSYQAPEVKKHLAAVRAAFVPQDTAAKLLLAAAYDDGDYAAFTHSSLGNTVDAALLNDGSGEHTFFMRGQKCNRMSLEFFCPEPGVDVHLTGFATSVNMRQEIVG